MKPNELRIGNFISNGNVIKTEFYMLNPGLSDEIDYQPIPITEEWLLKFGFECWGLKKPNQYEHETTYALYNSIEGTSTFMVCLNESWYGGSTVKQWIVKIDYNSIYVHDMDYVHQLQNLYFALTGKELVCVE